MLVIDPEAPGLPGTCGPHMCGPYNAAIKTLRAVWNFSTQPEALFYLL